MVKGFSIKWKILITEIAIFKDWEIKSFGLKLIGKVKSSTNDLKLNFALWLKIKVTNKSKDENFHPDSETEGPYEFD